MNSVKNLLVCVMLMGVSYGAFQVISSPDPFREEDESVETLDSNVGPRNAIVDGSSSTNQQNFGSSSYPVDLPTPPPEFWDNRSAKSTGSDNSTFRRPETSNIGNNPPAPGNEPGPGDKDRFAGQLSAPPAAAKNIFEPTEPPNDPVAFQETPENPPAPTLTPSINPNPGSQPLVIDKNQFVSKPAQMEPVPPKTGSNDKQSELIANLDNGGTIQGNQSFQTSPSTEDLDFVPNRNSGGGSDSRSNVNQFAAQQQQQATNSTAHQFNQFQPTPDNQSPHNDLAFQPNHPNSGAGGKSDTPTKPDKIDWPQIGQLAENGQLQQALRQLTRHYGQPMPQDQQLKLLNSLDELAGVVIYSTEHHMANQPYVVGQNESLESLAEKWRVPAMLIYNINFEKLNGSERLTPGTELKMVQGPFDAVVDLEKSELTLFLGDLYAGRFPITIGRDGNGIPHGTFKVQAKQSGREYVSVDGQRIAANSPSNPYGQFWIGLGERLSIHEFDPDNNPGDTRGSIRVAKGDAADVFGILSTGSSVTVIR